jgi:hypothetical protein
MKVHLLIHWNVDLYCFDYIVPLNENSSGGMMSVSYV